MKQSVVTRVEAEGLAAGVARLAGGELGCVSAVSETTDVRGTMSVVVLRASVDCEPWDDEVLVGGLDVDDQMGAVIQTLTRRAA
jgi:hypothetical protein